MSAPRIHSDQPPPPFVGWKWSVKWAGPDHLLVELLDAGESEFVVTERTVDISYYATESQVVNGVHAAMSGIRDEFIRRRERLNWVNTHWGI